MAGNRKGTGGRNPSPPQCERPRCDHGPRRPRPGPIPGSAPRSPPLGTGWRPDCGGPICEAGPAHPAAGPQSARGPGTAASLTPVRPRRRSDGSGLFPGTSGESSRCRPGPRAARPNPGWTGPGQWPRARRPAGPPDVGWVVAARFLGVSAAAPPNRHPTRRVRRTAATRSPTRRAARPGCRGRFACRCRARSCRLARDSCRPVSR